MFADSDDLDSVTSANSGIPTVVNFPLPPAEIPNVDSSVPLAEIPTVVDSSMYHSGIPTVVISPMPGIDTANCIDSSVPHSEIPTIVDSSVPANSQYTIPVLQCKIRQGLSVMSNCTYIISDCSFLESSLAQIKLQLSAYKLHTDKVRKCTHWRRNRRLVKGNVASTGLRRRLQVIRAKQRQKKILRKRRKAGTCTFSNHAYLY
jgi:hypothetical protein